MLSGEMRFLSEHVLTPWPSWSIVANVQADKSAVSRLTDGLGDKCREFDSPESREGAGKQFIMDTFGYPAQDVEGWLAQVRDTRSCRLQTVPAPDINSPLPSTGLLPSPTSERAQVLDHHRNTRVSFWACGRPHCMC